MNHMKAACGVAWVVGLLSSALGVVPPGVVEPFETTVKFEPVNRIDELVLAALEAKGIQPAALCSDEVFVRRVYLDVIGKLPTVAETAAFVQESGADKRARLIDGLLRREEYVDYWTMKWCDLLRLKSEHPINLWPNGVQAYHQWIRHSVAANKPYDQFARELLTSSGSNFRVPAVNFYRAIQGQSPSAIASAVGLTFMGVRVEGWPAERREQLEAFFSRVAYKPTAEWKEEIVYLDPTPHPELEATLPDGRTVRIEPGDDPRRVFADWLITAENPYFARNIANRTWSWLMGRGIIHEPDDIRPDNPPTNAALLAYLQDELVRSKYDMKHLFRLILNSRTYQQSSIPRSDDAQAAGLFASYAVRRMEAEVLVDALVDLLGEPEGYESQVAEPFTYVPEYERTVALADGTITSPFLEMFGRPSRDTGLESERSNDPTDAQRMYLINSSQVQRRIERSWRFNQIVRNARGDRDQIITGLYMTILSRRPTAGELEAARTYLTTSPGAWRTNVPDLAWALINAKEFLYRH